jgi:ABC-type multidrug transport system fused ATPase/permease subunit
LFKREGISNTICCLRSFGKLSAGARYDTIYFADCSFFGHSSYAPRFETGPGKSLHSTTSILPSYFQLLTLTSIITIFVPIKTIHLSLTIHTKNLVKVYGNRTVVNNVSFEVKQGEIVGLLGPNGAGKTTSFYQVVGLIRPDSGQVFLGDEDITRLPMYKRAQLGIGYLPQEASVFRKLSVEDNIMAVLEMTSLTSAARRERLEDLPNSGSGMSGKTTVIPSAVASAGAPRSPVPLR